MASKRGQKGKMTREIRSAYVRTRSTMTRDRVCNFGAPSPLEALHWIFCFFSSFYVQFSKTSPLKSGESSETSSGENRVESCRICGCHGFFGPDYVFQQSQGISLCPHDSGQSQPKRGNHRGLGGGGGYRNSTCPVEAIAL